MPTAKSASGRIAQLDSLRGAAVMLVVLHHTLQAHAGAISDASSGIGAFLDLGRIGVVIFFLISGFVIVHAVPGDSLKDAGVFWKHRFFRLYPPFWVSVGAAVLVAALVGRSACCIFVAPVSMPGLLANLTMLPLRLHEPALIGVYWTLELELLFYGLISAITLAHQARYRTMLAGAFVLFLVAVSAAVFRVLHSGPTEIGKDQFFTTALHLSLMFSGAAMRYVWSARRDAGFLASLPKDLLGYFAALGLFFATVVAIKLRHGVDPHTFRVAATYLLAVGSFVVSLNFFRGSRIGRYFGDRSYGIYLLHVPILSLVSLAASYVPGLRLSYLAYFLLVSALSLVAADVLRRLVEKPAIRMAHRTPARFLRQPAMQVEAAYELSADVDLASNRTIAGTRDSR